MIKKYAAAIAVIATISSLNLFMGVRGVMDYLFHVPGASFATLFANVVALATVYPAVHWLVTLRKLDLWEKDRLALEAKLSKLKGVKPSRKVVAELESINLEAEELLARRPVFLFGN